MSWTMSRSWIRPNRAASLAGALALMLVGMIGLTACGGYSGSDKVTGSHHKFLRRSVLRLE